MTKQSNVLHCLTHVCYLALPRLLILIPNLPARLSTFLFWTVNVNVTLDLPFCLLLLDLFATRIDYLV
jgi:hypothetical protein